MNAVKRAQGPGLLIACAVNATIDARLVHKARAHDARLERHIHRAAAQAPAAQLLRGSFHRHELCVARRVLVCLAAVVSRSDNTRLIKHAPARGGVYRVVDDHGTNGDLSQRSRLLGLLNGHAHVVDVLLWSHEGHYTKRHRREGRAKGEGAFPILASAKNLPGEQRSPLQAPANLGISRQRATKSPASCDAGLANHMADG